MGLLESLIAEVVFLESFKSNSHLSGERIVRDIESFIATNNIHRQKILKRDVPGLKAFRNSIAELKKLLQIVQSLMQASSIIKQESPLKENHSSIKVKQVFINQRVDVSLLHAGQTIIVDARFDEMDVKVKLSVNESRLRREFEIMQLLSRKKA